MAILKMRSLKKMLLAAVLALPLTAISFTIQNASAATMQDVQKRILLQIQQGDYDGAIATAESFDPAHPNHQARVEFVRGMVAKAQGRNAEAAGAFRKVLAVQPDLMPARQQLAHALFLDQDFDAARHHFDILQSTTTDPRLRQLYASYGRAMDKQRPWSLSGYVTLAPSTNVNKGSGKETATLFGNNGWQIPKEQQAKTGLGVAAGGSGSYAVKIEDGFALVFAGGADGRFYKDKDSDSTRINGSIKPTFETDDFKVSIGPYASASFSGYDHSLTQYGIDADIGVKLDHGLLLSGSVAALKQDFENNSRDGKKYSVDASLTKSLDSTTVVGVMGSFVN